MTRIVLPRPTVTFARSNVSKRRCGNGRITANSSASWAVRPALRRWRTFAIRKCLHILGRDRAVRSSAANLCNVDAEFPGEPTRFRRDLRRCCRRGRFLLRCRCGGNMGGACGSCCGSSHCRSGRRLLPRSDQPSNSFADRNHRSHLRGHSSQDPVAGSFHFDDGLIGFDLE